MTSKIVLVLTIICMFSYTPLYAYRIAKPARITDYDQSGLVIINKTLEGLFDITNGRYNPNFTTTNPDGVTKGDKNDILILYTGTKYYIEINVDGGTTWRGCELTNVP